MHRHIPNTPLTLESQITRSSDDVEVRQAPLLELARRVAWNRDETALAELIANRRPCRNIHGESMRIIDYVHHFADHDAPNGHQCCSTMVVEGAADLTIDKFIACPAERSNDQQPTGLHGRTHRCSTDCRHYWQAYTRYAERQLQNHPPGPPWMAERRAGQMLQRFIDRQFRLSLSEQRRRENNTWSRYEWVVRGTTLMIWMPRWVYGSHRRQWLDEHVPNVEPDLHGAQQRVQQFVNEWFDRDGEHGPLNVNQSPVRDGLPWSLEYGLSTHGLAETVATEKQARIDEQRPAIRRIGAMSLGALIREIYDALQAGTYQPSKVGEEYGLSKSTMTRFAGSSWPDSQAIAAVPDLWRNTAQVLAEHAPFREAAQAAGVWDRVSAVVNGEHKDT